MDEGSGRNWRDIVWQLFKPALVAAIVALLVALGVTGLTLSSKQLGGSDVGVATVGTHFTGPLYVTKGIQTSVVTATTLVSQTVNLDVVGGVGLGSNLTFTVGGLVNSQGGVTVTDQLVVSSQVIAQNGVLATGGVTVTGAGSVSEQLTVLNGLVVNSITMTTGSLVNSQGAVTVTDAFVVSGVSGLASGLSVANAVTVTGPLSVTGLSAVGGALQFAKKVAQTLTGAETISCAGGVYQPITAAGGVGATVDPTGAVSGQLCIIVNTAAQNIVITDTGTTILSGNITLTQYDPLGLLFDGTNWLELWHSAN